jgi:hypothetical protein
MWAELSEPRNRPLILPEFLVERKLDAPEVDLRGFFPLLVSPQLMHCFCWLMTSILDLIRRRGAQSTPRYADARIGENLQYGVREKPMHRFACSFELSVVFQVWAQVHDAVTRTATWKKDFLCFLDSFLFEFKELHLCYPQSYIFCLNEALHRFTFVT